MHRIVYFVSGRPDSPHNCSVLNQTTDSLHVECTEGFDGGLSQEFTLEMDLEVATDVAKAGQLVYNFTGKAPIFSVTGLDPGSTYHVTVFASNLKGRSEPVRLKATTLNLPERRTGKLLSIITLAVASSRVSVSVTLKVTFYIILYTYIIFILTSGRLEGGKVNQ